MVIHERIIKFPVPNWDRIINSDLDSTSYCICYQYHFNSNNYGPYGFNTDNSLKIINQVFPELFFLNERSNDGNKLLTKTKEIKKNGVYLYGNEEEINSLDLELTKYYLAKNKNEIKLRKSLDQDPLPTEPLLLSLLKGNIYDSETIIKILNLDCGLFIKHHYSPEAGDTFILFDKKLITSFKTSALNYGIEFVEVNSIDDLKSW